MDEGDGHEICSLCCRGVDPRHELAAALACAACGRSVLHQDCIDRYLNRISFHKITTRKAGTIFGFPCPKGRGKESVDDVCRGKIQQSVTLCGMMKSQVKRAKNIEKAQRQVSRTPKLNHQHHAAELANPESKSKTDVKRPGSLLQSKVLTQMRSYKETMHKEIMSKAGAQAFTIARRPVGEVPKVMLLAKSLGQTKDQTGLQTTAPKDLAGLNAAAPSTKYMSALSKPCSSSSNSSSSSSGNYGTVSKHVRDDENEQQSPPLTKHLSGCFNSDTSNNTPGSTSYSPIMNAFSQTKEGPAEGAAVGATVVVAQLKDTVKGSTESGGLPPSPLETNPMPHEDVAHPSTTETTTTHLSINYNSINHALYPALPATLYPASPARHQHSLLQPVNNNTAPAACYYHGGADGDLFGSAAKTPGGGDGDAFGSASAKAHAGDGRLHCFSAEDITVPDTFFVARARSMEAGRPAGMMSAASASDFCRDAHWGKDDSEATKQPTRPAGMMGAAGDCFRAASMEAAKQVTRPAGMMGAAGTYWCRDAQWGKDGLDTRMSILGSSMDTSSESRPHPLPPQAAAKQAHGIHDDVDPWSLKDDHQRIMCGGIMRDDIMRGDIKSDSAFKLFNPFASNPAAIEAAAVLRAAQHEQRQKHQGQSQQERRHHDAQHERRHHHLHEQGQSQQPGTTALSFSGSSSAAAEHHCRHHHHHQAMGSAQHGAMAAKTVGTMEHGAQDSSFEGRPRGAAGSDNLRSFGLNMGHVMHPMVVQSQGSFMSMGPPPPQPPPSRQRTGVGCLNGSSRA